MNVDTEYFKSHILPLKNKLFRKALSITESVVEAEDVVQEVMMKLWSMRANWTSIDNMEVYTMVLAKNTALDKVKQATCRSGSVEMDGAISVASDSPHPQENMERAERIALVWKVIRRLPEKLQELIRLREIEEYSYRDIAGEMNITEAQVKVNLFRARQKMKEIYLELNTHDGY